MSDHQELEEPIQKLKCLEHVHLMDLVHRVGHDHDLNQLMVGLGVLGDHLSFR